MDALNRWKNLPQKVRNTVVAIVLVAMLLFAWARGVGDADQVDLEDRRPAVTTTTSRAPAKWLGHYDYDLKRQVDRFGQECSELQEAFDWIDSARDGLKRKYGRNGVHVMQWLHDKMDRQGCYD